MKDFKNSTQEDRIRAFYEASKDFLDDEALLKLVSMDFCDAPASTKYHGAYQGGLLEHSINVMDNLVYLTETLSLQWERKESPLIIGLLHDLCKVDQYKYSEETHAYVWDDSPIVKGHGTKSVIYIQKYCGINLTEEEIACITYHMGAFCPKEEWKDYTEAIHKYPNVLWVHTADMYATHVMEVENGK